MGWRWDGRRSGAMGLRCKRCGSGEHVKNGFMKGLQRYRCKVCGLNFTDTPPRGMPLRVKVRAVVVELDEMWHFLKKSGISSGSGRLGIVLQAEWLTGNVGVVTPAP